MSEYYSTIAGKGVLLPESKVILRTLSSGKNIDQIRHSVIEKDLLDRRTRESRSKVWKEVYRRYISGRSPEHVSTLAKMVSHCANSTAVDLILFYEFCQADTLLYDLTACCTYELYQSARTSIDQVDVNEWLTSQERIHPEIATWSPITRNRLLGGYLATIRDFGLVQGIKQKEFHKLYVPREAFIYALYHQKDRAIEGKEAIQSSDWRLFLLSEQEVTFMLEDAARGGFVTFRHAGDIYDLQYSYKNLREVVDAVID